MRQEFLFNNEAICLASIACTIDACGPLPVEKCLVAATLLLHPPTVTFLKHGRTNVGSLDEIAANKPELIYNFNDRFHSLLPVCINALVIGLDTSVLGRDASNYKIVDESFLAASLGRRAEVIRLASRKLPRVMSVASEHLYFTLRVEL